jgi:hypothetical protein
MLWFKLYFTFKYCTYFLASECKERWKNLKACYTRHLKNKLPSGSGAKTKRPYYLAEYLNFLEPFTKSRKQTGF